MLLSTAAGLVIEVISVNMETSAVKPGAASKLLAASVTRPTNIPCGDRVTRVGDPYGNLWWIMTRSEDLDEEEIGRRYGEPEYIEAMQYVQSAGFFPTEQQKAKQ